MLYKSVLIILKNAQVSEKVSTNWGSQRLEKVIQIGKHPTVKRSRRVLLCISQRTFPVPSLWQLWRRATGKTEYRTAIEAHAEHLERRNSTL
ncbi:hypothetical protein POVWA2_042830 [Plasmodium ovale wallikeri]|uniref:Uncharacterized protein n=1 Tax=Plasmodium ovale wallikeri TaxID=864142 RepID=A0A1A8ZCF9_PLAOA|nr:hypothetical protein POVWA1_044230 [Plasmodium ovale wallikeri]SBT41983.1 hypothetical protein POVWA2_042830 [Plasmodium ovale wallikeri]